MSVKIQKIMIYTLLTLGGLVILYPLWWMIVVSLSTPGEALARASGYGSYDWLPADPQWDNYARALRGMGFVTSEAGGNSGLDRDMVMGSWEGFADAFANSVVITCLSVLGQLISCSMVGYAFAKLRFRGRSTAFNIMLATMMLPAQATMIPVFLLFRSLGWIDSFLPLIVPAFFGSAFYIFLFRQFFSQIPQDLLDSAKIDGAGHLRIWWNIMIPMCKPVMAITAIFTFLGVWNDFLMPLIYLNSPENYTLAIALNSFYSQYGGAEHMHLLMAASLVTVIPCIVLFFVAQRYFIKGLNVGGVKG